MGCCCRHDAAISLANIFKSGKQRSLPLALLRELLASIEVDCPVGILYDIGCSLHKYIQAVSKTFYISANMIFDSAVLLQRDLFSEYASWLTFGTSIFHSYIHNWGCQLDYSPRFNSGWGMSDGEGLERMWSYLSALVGPLQYATRNHQLGAIAHQLKHHNTRSIKQLC